MSPYCLISSLRGRVSAASHPPNLIPSDSRLVREPCSFFRGTHYWLRTLGSAVLLMVPSPSVPHSLLPHLQCSRGNRVCGSEGEQLLSLREALVRPLVPTGSPLRERGLCLKSCPPNPLPDLLFSLAAVSLTFTFPYPCLLTTFVDFEYILPLPCFTNVNTYVFLKTFPLMFFSERSLPCSPGWPGTH